MSSRWLSPLAAGAGCLLLIFLCAPALHSFFANDDWLLLQHYGQIPLSRPWEFLSPRVIFFYRPIQALQFGLFYHWFGLNEVPYNVALFAGHLTVCALVYWLLAEVTERPGLAALATVLFAAPWYYSDVLLWKANFNTLHWAILTLAACGAFARWIRTGKPGWRSACYVLCVLDFLSKESAVNTVLLLGLVWLVLADERKLRTPRGRTELVRGGWSALWPVAAMAAVYLGLHALFVVEIIRLDYRWATPADWVPDILLSYNMMLLSAAQDAMVLPALQKALGTPGLWLRMALAFAAAKCLFLPLVVLGYAAWRRDRLLLFGLAWILVSFLPVIFLRDFQSSRYYYLPAVGAGLVLARLVDRAYTALSEKENLLRSLGRVGLLLGCAWWLTANSSAMQLNVLRDAGASDSARAIFQTIHAEKGHLEPGAVVVLRHAPPGYFDKGMGVRQMVQLALADPSAEGVSDGPDSAAEIRALAAARRPIYVIDPAVPGTLALRKM